MANRAFWNLQSMAARVMLLAARILWSAGNPVLQAYNTQTGQWQSAAAAPFGGGWLTSASVVRNSAGDFTLTLTDNYVAYLAAPPSWENATGIVSTAPNVALKTAGIAMNPQTQGATIEFVTSSPSTSTVTGATNIITGATGTSTGGVTTLSAGTSAAPTGYAINALKGMIISDGTTTAVVLSNTAIVASGGTISGGTITTSVNLAATITATLAVTQLTTTLTPGVATDPANGDILNLELFLADTDGL